MRVRLLVALTALGLMSGHAATAQEASSRGASTAAPAAGCVETFDPAVDYFPDKVSSAHSVFWQASYHGHYKVLTVADTEKTGDARLRYVLVQCGTPTPELTGDLEGALVVQVPVDRAAVTHRNVLAMIDEVERVPTIVGLARPFLTYAEKDRWYAGIVERASSPQTIGTEDDLDLEVVLSLEPDAVFMAGYGPDYDEVTTARGRGMPAVMVSNRTEPTPLGSAEWLKFIAAFYNREATANARFAQIEADYTAIAGRVAGRLPEGFEAAYACLGEGGGCGFMYAHGDRTLNGQILELMGTGNPFAAGNDQPNGMEFDYEAALARARDVDFFVVYYIDSPAALAADARYRNIPALADGRYVISTVPNYHECNAVTYVRVDRLVRDYAIGMLPDLFPGEEGTCFRKP